MEITQNTIQKTLSSLSTKRSENNATYFCSEADFQFALGWELKEMYPEIEIRFEYLYETKYIDIWIEVGNDIYPIELKYKTKTDASMPDLKYHGAQDFGRYDYLHDIKRIEDISLSLDSFKRGFAIFLTNDDAYLNPGREGAMDELFWICENREIPSGTYLQWKDKRAYQQGRDKFTLKNKYKMKWVKYSEKFHYLISSVEKAAQ